MLWTCVGYIDKNDYKNSVDQAIQFVSGKSRDIQKNLSKEMETASDQLDFEKLQFLEIE
jgi:excinuclease ABC subunit C